MIGLISLITGQKKNKDQKKTQIKDLYKTDGPWIKINKTAFIILYQKIMKQTIATFQQCQ